MSVGTKLRDTVAPPPLAAERGRPAGLAGYGHAKKPTRPRAASGYGGETYYERPALKPSPYGWMVAAYIWVGGLGGAAQIIATIADLVGGTKAKTAVRRGRHIAVASAPVGAALLIADLHTPQRFYNMLRIFRATSPMSIGTYVLSAFTLFSGAAALADGLGRPLLARAASIPAALAGAGMTSYTAALLASTSTPHWAVAPRGLAIRFAASSVASGAAALSLAERVDGQGDACVSLDRLAMAASAVELAATALGDGAPQEAPKSGFDKIGALTLGGALPLALYALGERRRGAAVVAAAAVLAGSFAMRWAVLRAGNQSARRPRDYFALAQPGRLEAASRPLLTRGRT